MVVYGSLLAVYDLSTGCLLLAIYDCIATAMPVAYLLTNQRFLWIFWISDAQTALYLR